MSDGMQQVYRSAQLVAERIRAQEAAKKNEPYRRKDLSQADLDPLTEYLELASGETCLHAEGLGPTRFTRSPGNINTRL